MNELKCIKCGTQPKPAFSDDHKIINHPHGATVFTTHGHYGSTVYDSINGNEYIEITVCDSCLVEAAQNDRVLECFTTVKSIKDYEKWNPHER